MGKTPKTIAKERASDDRILAMLSMRWDGYSVAQIAARFNTTFQSVQAATNKVRRADDAYEPGAARYYG